MGFIEYILSLPYLTLVIYFFVTGSIFGSFANVVIHRTLQMIQKEEERESVVSSKTEARGDDLPPASTGVRSDAGAASDAKRIISGAEMEKNGGGSEGDSPSFLEDSSDRTTVNEQAASTDSKTLSEAIDDFYESPPITLKERFADRIMQHVEFFYCLFIFCVKKPVRFVWRRLLSVIKLLRKKRKQKNPSSSSYDSSLTAGELDHHVKSPASNFTSLHSNGKAGSEQDKTSRPHSTEKEESFPLDLMGRSRCPHCNYKIPFYLNIPILSWFFLRGRCRNCQVRLSFRYPLVEFLMACLFAGLFVLVGWKWFFLEALIFVFGLVVVSFIDWDRMILPSFFTLPGIYLGLLGGFLNPERAFSSALIGWLAGGFILWLSGYLYFKIRRQEGMGDGDVSLMGWIGAVLGWKSISFVLIVSCFFGVVFGFWGMLRNKKDARTPFPFGPCLAVGAVCYLFIQLLVPDFLRLFSPF